MAIQTKLKSLVPAADALKRELVLISGGYTVREECPGGKITVFPWDSEVSEWVVEQAEKDGSGTQFSAAVVGRVTKLPAKTVDKLVASELLVIMLVSRALTSDGSLRYQAKCPHCGYLHPHSSIKVPEQLGVVGKKPENYPGYDTLILPAAQDEIKVRPLTVRDVALIEEDVQFNKASGLSRNSLNTMASIIEVGGGRPDSREELLTYFKALAPSDREWLTMKLNNEINPGLDVRIPHTCDKPSCKRDFTYNLGLNYDFFLSSLQ